MMHKTVGVVASLMLACICVFADEAPPKQDAVPQAKKSETAKKVDQKAKAPSGYEDAPEARAQQPLRRVGARDFLREAAAEAVVIADGDLDGILAAQVNAQVANREKQFLPQFTPLMTAELSFMNRVCDLDLEQRKKIKAASDSCLKAAVRMYAMRQDGRIVIQQDGRMVAWQGRIQPQTIPDPTELLHQMLTKVLEETLQPQQRSAYDDEMAKRTAYRRRAAIEGVVSIIDKSLLLTNEQRQKLTESLDKNWQPSWVQSIEMLINNAQNLPSIPDQFVVPTLNESQRQVWRTAPKTSYAVWGGFAWGNQVGAVDDFPLVEAVADVENSPAN